MEKLQVTSLYNQDQRIDIQFPGMRREASANIVRHVDLSEAGGGVITYSQLDKNNADDIIREQISYFQGIGQDFEWKIYDYDQPLDLKERLEKHGFAAGEAEAILVLDLEEAPEVLWQPVTHNLQRIVEPEKIVDIISVHQQVWDEDVSWLSHYLGEALRNYAERMSLYVAYLDEEPVSAGWIYFPEHSQFASLWGGSTVKRFRKQGLYTALLAKRAQEANERGVRYLTVDASPMSRPILEKFSFEMMAYSYPCKWKQVKT